MGGGNSAGINGKIFFPTRFKRQRIIGKSLYRRGWLSIVINFFNVRKKIFLLILLMNTYSKNFIEFLELRKCHMFLVGKVLHHNIGDYTAEHWPHWTACSSSRKVTFIII